MTINLNIDPWHALIVVATVLSVISTILCIGYRVVLKEITKIVYGQTKFLKEFMSAKLTNSSLSVEDVANALKGNTQSKQEQSSNSKLK